MIWRQHYPESFVELNQYVIQRLSPARDWGVFWYDTFTYDSPNIWKSSSNILSDPQVVTFDRWVVEGTRKNSKAELRGAGDWWWDSLDTVYVYSMAEPSTVRIGKATDFAGNPIIGNPDVGAFEWQFGYP